MKLNKLHPFYQEDLDFVLKVKCLDNLRGKSILITGATGMVGVCLIDALMKFNKQGDARISIYSVSKDQEKAFFRLGEYFSDPLFHFIKQDVRSPFVEDLSVDYIIPLASNTHPFAYSNYPVETIEICVKGTENALIKAKQCGAIVLYPSSVEIYGNGEGVFDEGYTGKLNLFTSRACYTEAKRVGEALCQSYITEYGVDCRIVRLSRLFGPTMQNSDTKASSQFILKALKGEDIILKSKGEQIFSYTYIADAAQAILHVLLNGECGQVYNIASDECNVKLADFAKACAELAGTSVVFEMPSDFESRGFSIASRAILSTNKLSGIGWKASYSFIKALYRTVSILIDD